MLYFFPEQDLKRKAQICAYFRKILSFDGTFCHIFKHILAFCYIKCVTTYFDNFEVFVKYFVLFCGLSKFKILFNIFFRCVSANIPFFKIENKSFNYFLGEYCNRIIPSESTLRKKYLDVCFRRVFYFFIIK